MTEYSLSHFNCSLIDVKEASSCCSNNTSSPNGISVRIIKTIANSLLHPLTITFKHSFYDAMFTTVWKDAIIIPLYKDSGNRDSATSYRPTSLCHCLGKIREKIAHKQLSSYLNDNKLLHPAQHGFTQRLSTMTNLLIFYAHITMIISAGHA